MNQTKFIKALKKKWWLILIVILVTTGLTATYLISFSKQLYQAKTSMYITGNESKGLTSESIAVGIQLVKNYDEIVKSEKVTYAVVEKLKESGIDDKVTWNVQTSAENESGSTVGDNSNILQVFIQDSNEEKAKIVANSYAQVLIKTSVEISNQININIIDESKAAYPVSKNIARKVGLSFFLSLVLISSLICLIEYSKNEAYSVSGIKK